MTLGLLNQIVSNGGARVKWLALLVAFALTAFALPCEASPFDPAGTDWEGYSDFVRLIRTEIGENKLVVTSRIDWSTLTGRDVIILVYPDHSPSTTSAGAFVRAGGRLALLDDFGAGDVLLESFDIKRVPLPARPLLALRDNPDLAIAEPGDEHVLTQGVDRVVTNHASGLSQSLLTKVLRVRSTGGDDVALALVADTSGGRLVAVGDPSIAMNAMLRYPGNRNFARNLVQYLTREHSKGNVYLVVTRFAEAGTFAGPESPAREWWDAAARARAAFARDGLPTWTTYWLSFLVAGAMLAWLLPRAARAYRGQAPRFTRGISLRAQGGAAGHAAGLGAKDAWRGYGLIEWKSAFVDDLTHHFGLRREVSSAEILRHVAALGVLPAEAIREVERVLLRMADIDTMVLSKDPRALGPVRDEEVIAAGKLMQRVLEAVHGQVGKHR
jgi:hypothetical protein